LKVLLTGANGQLGTALRSLVPPGVDLIAHDIQTLDLGDAAQVGREMRRVAPAVVINAAAYTQVDQAESDRDAAFRVNAEGPRLMAEAVAAQGVRLIHVSTDFVFSGDQAVPYQPDAATGPVNVYGESKLAGEKAVLAALGNTATVVRTSWLYAAAGRNFVKTMLSLMASRESLGVVVDQVGSPTWANTLARAVWDMARDPAIHGLQHWTDEGVASWYDFAVAIQEEALARRLLPKAIPIRAIPASDYPTPARRPSYSVLDKRATAALLGYSPPHWRQSLRNMLDELAASSS
jgi:dTDP-4-dehydrorhamnose reductase